MKKQVGLMLCVLTVLALVGSMSATAQPVEPESQEYSGRPCYGVMMLSKFHRGFMNVAFSWMEIPRAIQAKERIPCRRGCCGLLRNPTVCAVHSVASGTILGAVKGGFRAVGGAMEMVLFPIPPYGSVMEPPYPRPLVFNPPVAPCHEMGACSRGCGMTACGGCNKAGCGCRGMAARCQSACPAVKQQCPMTAGTAAGCPAVKQQCPMVAGRAAGCPAVKQQCPMSAGRAAGCPSGRAQGWVGPQQGACPMARTESEKALTKKQQKMLQKQQQVQQPEGAAGCCPKPR